MILLSIVCPVMAVPGPNPASIKSPGEGHHRHRHRHRRTIVNGSTAGKNEYQYASSIQLGSRHICGASLIAPDIILSAAHCFNVPGDNSDGRLTVVIGEYHLQNREDKGQVFLVEKIDVHPDYLETLQYLENDVMLMKVIGRSERKIVKLNHDHNLPVLAIDALTVVGWGSLDANGVIMANVLQEVQLGYITNQECQKRGIPLVTDQMMCAADMDGDSLTEDSCYGDSGGPLILTDPSVASRNKDVQVGIVSFGSKTCGQYPGVYTRISSVYGWIRDGVCNLSTDAPIYFHCDKTGTGVVFDEERAPTTAPTKKGILSSRPTAMPTNAPSFQKQPTPIPSASTNEPTASPSIPVPVATNEPTKKVISTNEPTSSPSIAVPVATNEPTKNVISTNELTSSPSILVPVATNEPTKNVIDTTRTRTIEPTTSDSNKFEKKETQLYSQSHNTTSDVDLDKETRDDEPKAVYVVLGPSTSNGKSSNASRLEAIQLLSLALCAGAFFIMTLI